MTGQAAPFEPPAPQVESWQQTLASHSGKTLGESEALALLRDFEIPVVDHANVASEAELLDAASALGYPIVLKTAQPGIHHKSDCGGVVVGIESEQELLRHYRNMVTRLGPLALLSQMAGKGIEVALGTVNDRQFGPVIMVAAGGILVELLDDRQMAMCPLSPAQASAMLDSLKLNRLLQGVRGKPPVKRQALIDIIVKLSQLAFDLRDGIAEIDINPVIVTVDEAIAVDALVLCQADNL
jgi:succinyl-CoA synthetase beta subunit